MAYSNNNNKKKKGARGATSIDPQRGESQDEGGRV